MSTGDQDAIQVPMAESNAVNDVDQAEENVPQNENTTEMEGEVTEEHGQFVTNVDTGDVVHSPEPVVEDQMADQVENSNNNAGKSDEDIPEATHNDPEAASERSGQGSVTAGDDSQPLEQNVGENDKAPDESAAEGDPTSAELKDQNDAEQAVAEASTGEKESQDVTEQNQEPAEEEAKMEDKATPEPPTEHIAMGTDSHMEAQVEMDPDHGAQSPELDFDPDATATVKFVLMPSQNVATLRCHLTQPLAELKEHFASELKIPPSAIMLLLDGKNTENSATLGDLGVGPNGTIRLELQSTDPETQPIKALKPRQEYTMPDVITVRVQTEDKQFTDVVVEIERSMRKKPFLGGYKHKKTGVEFHHASAQTVQKQRPPPTVQRFCRDTQTTHQKHITQQTTNDMSTQMTKIGVHVSNMEDKLVIPGNYTTADDFKANVLNNVVVIQKYYRRWLAQRYVNNVRENMSKREEWEKEEEVRKKKEKGDRIQKEFERRMNPKTKEDFDLLYHALEKWRREEEENINKTLSGAERKAALCQLLDQEAQLIASIGRHKLEADTENRDKSVQNFLEQASAAKKWKGRDGKTTEMDTPYTLRAQELKDIYNSVNMKYLTQDERLDVLLTVKHTVKEHDCKLTQEIIELIDREADLLMRGVKESNLEGLRKRITTLFLQYIKTPTFNPEAARLLKVPQDPSTLRKNIYFCPSCTQYLPSTEFQLSSNSRAVGKCRKCNKMDNDARVRQDYSHYRYMLKSIRQQEDTYSDGSKIAFLIQENDLRYLVENVWSSQSVLSAWEDLYDLVLVRWDSNQEWAPWNSILLTKDEASAHEKLDDLEEAYGKVFIHKVKHKHTLARNYFSRLPGMAEHMRTKNNGSAVSIRGPAVSGKAVSRPVSVK